MKFKHETITKTINCPTCGKVASETIETRCREGNTKKDDVQELVSAGVFIKDKKNHSRDSFFDKETLFEKLKKS